MSNKSIRVFRGGSWYYDPQYARVALRYNFAPGYRNNDLGLRLVEVVDDPAPVSDAAESNGGYRGGSWDDNPHCAQRIYCGISYPGLCGYNVGIRLVEVIND